MIKKLPNRLIEAIKTTIIIILILSALVLSYSVWFYGESFDDVFSALFDSKQSEPGFYEEYEESSYTLSVVSPVCSTIRSDLGIYNSSTGESTSRASAQSVFESISPVLAEALSSAASPVQITNNDWNNALSKNMVLFDFEGEMPVWALCSALDAESDKRFSLSTRYLLIAINENNMLDIYFKSDSRRIYKSETKTSAAYMNSLFAEYLPNGYFFASETENIKDAPPEFIMRYDQQLINKLSVTNILDDLSGLDASRAIDTVLSAFDFNPYTAKSYSEHDNINVYVEELDTLRIFSDGYLTYYSPEVDELPGVDVSDAKKTSLISEAGRICQSISSYAGNINTYVIRAYYNDETQRFIILFGNEYNAVPIINDKGYYAKFEYKNAMLVSAEMSLKSYRAAELDTSLLPAVQAIAAASNGSALSEFDLFYNSNGKPCWLYYK